MTGADRLVFAVLLLDALLLAGNPLTAPDSRPSVDPKAGAPGAGDVEPRVGKLIDECWRHAKAIGAWGEGRAALEARTAPDGAGIVLGEFRETWPDLAAIEGVVAVNGVEVDRGFGRDVLGHPFEPLIWLARHLAERGEALRTGEIVMTGSLVPTRFPAAGDSLRFSLAGLGAVEMAVTA